MRIPSSSAALRRRLSFANVVSLLALFVALGGSSYAALSVGSGQITNNSVRSEDLRNNDVRGSDIRNNTIRSRDLRNNSITGRDVREDSIRTGDIGDNTVRGRDVKESTLETVPNASALDGKDSSAFLSSGSLKTIGLVKISHGQTKVVASSGPYTWSAACSDEGGGNTRLVVTVGSSVPNAYAASFEGGAPIPAGGSATIFDTSQSTPVYTIAFPFSAVGSGGTVPQGISFAGLKVAGADCVVNGFLLP